MTTRTRPITAPPYYQGRPAAFWAAIFAPRTSPHAPRRHRLTRITG
jgi:hypothetical protein